MFRIYYADNIMFSCVHYVVKFSNFNTKLFFTHFVGRAGDN